MVYYRLKTPENGKTWTETENLNSAIDMKLQQEFKL